ncbi:MAG: hypothetical protein MZU84_05060 [Sphingobacterium sp.]|nr:hypothetical protein [Sphingobacterium sp.]
MIMRACHHGGLGWGIFLRIPFFIDGTLRENLVWDNGGGDITDDKIWEMLEQVNAAHLAKRFRKGLDAFIANYAFAFSGGECQRLALAKGAASQAVTPAARRGHFVA